MRTEAGWRLHKWLGWHPIDGRDEHIIAVEVEAVKLERQRLRDLIAGPDATGGWIQRPDRSYITVREAFDEPTP